jgi:hypothetical protein
MKLTPAIKGQLTKAMQAAHKEWSTVEYIDNRRLDGFKALYARRIFAKHMPREQAKHAAKRYLRTAA